MIKIIEEEFYISRNEIDLSEKLPMDFIGNISKSYQEIYEESLRGQG